MTKKRKPTTKAPAGSSAAPPSPSTPVAEPPIGTIAYRPPREANKLATLADWRRIDKVLSIHEMSALLAAKWGHDEPTLVELLRGFIFRMGIRSWGRTNSDDRAWLAGLVQLVPPIEDLERLVAGEKLPAKEAYLDNDLNGLHLLDVADLLRRVEVEVPVAVQKVFDAAAREEKRPPGVVPSPQLPAPTPSPPAAGPIDDAIVGTPNDEKRLATMRSMRETMTDKDIGEMFGISGQRVGQILGSRQANKAKANAPKAK